MSDDVLLSAMWFVPLLGAGLVLLVPARFPQAVKWLALGVTAVTLALGLVAFRTYTIPDSPASASLEERGGRNVLEPYQRGDLVPNENLPGKSSGVRDLMVRHVWIGAFHVEYFLGVDGVSLSLLLLTALVSLLACGASWSIDRNVKGYFSLFLLLLATMMGVFLALDLVLFYLFFEVMLIPMYFLIAVWGGDRREYAALKFLLYTLFGSVFILVAILALFFWGGDGGVQSIAGVPFQGHTFDMVRLTQATATTSYYGLPIQRWIFLLFFIGFCVKLPAFPFHTWLPDAHVEAPTPISMILAGVLLKVGGYGLLRLAWPLAPRGAEDLAYLAAIVGVVSIVYGALAALGQTDFKKLVAYSSVSHMGYVTLGLAAMNLAPDARGYAFGVTGALYIMIAHGITSTGMFFLVGVIYDRTHTRDLAKLGGLLKAMPLGAAAAFVVFLGAMGLPMLCGFVGELFVLLAAYHYNPTLATIAAAAIVLTAGYILWTLQRVFFGEPTEQSVADLSRREAAIILPLAALTIVLGVLPQVLLTWAGPSVEAIVSNVARGNSPAIRTAARASAPPPAVAATPPR